jgi:hypothetical protein
MVRYFSFQLICTQISHSELLQCYICSSCGVQIHKKQHRISATGFVPVFTINVGEVISLAPQNYSQGLEMPSGACITPEFRYSKYSSKDAAACGLINSYVRFEGQWRLHLRSLALLAPEDEGTAVLHR